MYDDLTHLGRHSLVGSGLNISGKIDPGLNEQLGQTWFVCQHERERERCQQVNRLVFDGCPGKFPATSTALCKFGTTWASSEMSRARKESFHLKLQKKSSFHF